MSRAIGVVVSSRINAGLVEDHKLVGELRSYPENPDDHEALLEHPFDSLANLIVDQVMALHAQGPLDAVGVALPGIIRNGIVEDSPNLAQLKGANIAEALTALFQAKGINAPVKTLNDADAVACGLAASRGRLDRFVRVWTIGNGIGFGRYPYTEGVWEGGHMVVTLDPKEAFCGCGGKGHLEGIMGHRAMRLRFLDLEPEEVFANAAEGDARCCEFEVLWHRALAAASATSIHLEGPGKFFVSGPNSRFIKVSLLSQYLHEMVTMSPLQGSVFEVVPTSTEIAVIGAAVNARRAGPAVRGSSVK